ncbi:MAG: RNA polymerase subunit sigma-24 [Pirellulaceae bacterium]
MQIKPYSPLFVVVAVLIGTMWEATSGIAADVHRVARAGQQMNEAQKDDLEELVAKTPGDIESRTKLLGYYFTTGRGDPNAKVAKGQHVLWLINNAPESEVLGTPYSQLNKFLEPKEYASANEAWMAAIKASPNNLAIMKNAARNFLQSDREACEELLSRGQKADQSDPYWSSSLGQLYALGLSRIDAGPEKIAQAKKAFMQYEMAYELSSPIEKDAMLDNLAKTAFEAGNFAKAKIYAEEMLADQQAGWNSGNRTHHGNLVLGRIALIEDNVDEAKARLLAAGKTTGSPQLNSFGPNMTLAKELLERGERQVVLKYFILCGKFWKSPRRSLEEWTKEVSEHRIPNFGANLAY